MIDRDARTSRLAALYPLLTREQVLQLDQIADLAQQLDRPTADAYLAAAHAAHGRRMTDPSLSNRAGSGAGLRQFLARARTY